jgi:arylsulfatase
MQEIFNNEATKNHVFPIDDRRFERFNAETAGRPDLMGKRTSLTLYEGMTGITENTFINIKNKNYTITSQVELKDGNTNGVIISQAGRFGGWVLYMKGGKVHHEYNFFGLDHTNIASSKTLSAGTHQIKYEFIIDAPKPVLAENVYCM